MSNAISGDLGAPYIPPTPRNTTSDSGLADLPGASATAAPLGGPESPTASSAIGIPPDTSALQGAIGQLQAAARGHGSSLSFAIDQKSGSTVVKVIDGDTGKTIRQIPSEEALDIALNIEKTLSLMRPQKA